MNNFQFKILIVFVAILTAAGCAILPTGFDRPVSNALTDTQGSILGKHVSAEAAALTGKSGFCLLAY